VDTAYRSAPGQSQPHTKGLLLALFIMGIHGYLLGPKLWLRPRDTLVNPTMGLVGSRLGPFGSRHLLIARRRGPPASASCCMLPS